MFFKVAAFVYSKRDNVTLTSATSSVVYEQRTSASLEATENARAQISLGISSVSVKKYFDRCAFLVTIKSSA